MKARLGPARSLVAATALLIGVAPLAARAQATRTPNPNAPRLVVGTLRSSDKKLSVQMTEELRSRLSADIPFRSLTVITSADYKTVVEQSGYPYDEALSTGDLASLAKLLRTDEFVEGTVEKTATGFLIRAALTLTRDVGFTQPLPPAEGDRVSRAAAALSKSLQDARRQIDSERKCNSLGRDNRPADAIAAARAGVAAYPQATISRLCELAVRAGYKQPPDSLIAIALEVLKYDPKSKVAISYAADAYKAKGDQEKSTEMLVQLLATDPTNTKLVDDVVNALAAGGKSELAKPIISQAIKDNPGDVRLMRLGFLIYLATRDLKNGTALGEEMVKIDTSLADTSYFTKMVGAYDADSAFDKAIEAATRGVEKFPKNTTLLSMLGSEQLKTGQKTQAIATFRKLLAADPKAPSARMLIARTFDEMQLPDSTLAALREARAAGEDGQAVGGYAVTIGNRLYRAGQVVFTKAQASAAAAEKAPKAEKEQANKTLSEDRRAGIEENLRVMPWVSFADSAAVVPDTKNAAGFLMAVAAFNISYLALMESSTSKSCELARMAEQYSSLAQANVARGGRVNPQAVGQLMGAIPQIMSGADQMVKQYCKP